MMLIIPAVDIKGGKCVRLYEGREDMVKEYSNDPVEMAIFWENQGAERIHLVDLDGAMKGYPVNREIIFDIRKRVKCEIEVGGGIRREEDVVSYIDGGMDYIIVSTIFFKDVALFRRTVERFPQRILVSIDVRGDRAGIEGWKEDVKLDKSLIFHIINELPLAGVIITDIRRDGTLKGVSFDDIKDLVRAIDHPVYIAGGINSYDDISFIRDRGEGKVAGVIIGKALYEGRIEFQVALHLGKG